MGADAKEILLAQMEREREGQSMEALALSPSLGT
jgi:hypothetical protein